MSKKYFHTMSIFFFVCLLVVISTKECRAERGERLRKWLKQHVQNQDSSQPEGSSAENNGANSTSNRESDSTPVKSLVKIIDGAFPQWSPDGSQIVFTRQGKEQERNWFEVYVMRPDGSDIRCLTCGKSALPANGFRGQPYWHPSGKYIVFTAENAAYPRKGTLIQPPKSIEKKVT